MRIAHLADIHIRMKERHAEYEGVFKNLIDSLRKDDPDRIVVAGDVVHSKITMSPELVSLTRKFFLDLMEIAPVDVIAGNHDMNISNADRMDALTPIIDSVKALGIMTRLHPIEYFTKSGLHETDDVVYGVFSLSDGGSARLTPKKKVTDDGNWKPFIALYHGPVAGCVLENDYHYSDSTMALSTFKNYDFVFLGDIHRHQYLNDSKTAAYPGSLIQQNFGESMDKGYILWDINKDGHTSEFRKVDNEYGYYTLISSGDELPDLDLPSKCRIRVIWEMAAKDISRSATTSLTSKIYKKYKPLSVQLTFKPLDNDDSQVVSVEDGVNLADPSTQRDLLAQWLEKECEDPNEVQKIVDLDKSIYETVVDPSMEDSTSSCWSIKRLTIENFMSYREELILDFENLRGVIGLFGDNAAGKSVILDAILYALFNKISRNVKNEDLVNKLTDNPVCTVKLDMDIRGVDYRIERCTTRQYAKRTGEFINARTDVVFKRRYHGDDDWENLSETQRNETEKIIRNTIGSFEDFLLTSLTTQNHISVYGKLEATEFLSLRPALRSDNMLRFLGLDIFTKKYDYAKDILRALDRERKNHSEDDELNHLDTRRTELEEASQTISETEEQIEQIDTEIDDLRNRVSGHRRMINETIKIDKDVDSLRDEQSSLLSQIEDLKQAKSDLTSKIKCLVGKIAEFEDKFIVDEDKLSFYSEQARRAESLKVKIAAMTAEIDSDKRVLGLYRKDISSSNSCPVSYDGNHASCRYLKGYLSKKTECEVLIAKVKTNISRLDEVKSEYESLVESKSIIDAQEKARDAVIQATAKLNELRQNFNTLDNQLEVKGLSLNLVKSHLDIAVKNEDTIANNKRLKIDIDHLERKIDGKVKERKQLSDILIKVSGRQAVLEREIQMLEDALAKIRQSDEQIRIYNTYCKAMHRTGLPVEILRSYIPKVNYEINKILSDVVEFGLFFKIDQDSTDIDIVMRYDGDHDDTRPAQMASGMEKLLINFAIRYALISVSNLNKSNTWFIDEGFGVLDSENLYSMSKFFENVRGLFKNIVMITHIDSLKDIANWVVTIEKKDGISHINAPQKNI